MDSASKEQSSKILDLLTWKDKKTTLKFLAFVQVFFYFYWVRGNSLVNLVSRVCIVMVLWRLIKQGAPSKGVENGNEIVSEETLKEVYV